MTKTESTPGAAPSPGSPAAPPTERVSGFDLARAFAILGMVVINFKESFVAMDEAKPGLLTWLANLSSGRASTLFVTVAGAGILMMARGAPLGAVRKTLLLRSLFLFVAGNLLYFTWDSDILHFYAAYLLLSALFLIRLPRAALPPAAALFAIGGPALFSLFPGVDPDTIPYHSPLGMFQDIVAWGLHPVFPWLAFLLVGFWIAHHDLRDRGTRRSLALLGALLAFGAPIAAHLLGPLALAGLLPADLIPRLGTLWSPGLLFTVGRAGSAMLIIALAQSIVGRWPGALPIRALVATGQLSFTIYILHIVVGYRLFSRVTGIESYGVEALFLHVAAFHLAVIPASALYRRFFRRGPIEWLMRVLCGDTPKRTGAPVPLARLAHPPVWAWLAIAPALPAMLVLQFAGSPSSWLATAGALAPGRIHGEITALTDERAFALVLTEERELRLETFSDRDLFIEVVDESGEVVAEDDDGGAAYNARLWANLAPGRYRVVVSSLDKLPGGFLLETRIEPKRTIATSPPGTVLLEWESEADLDLLVNGDPASEEGGSSDEVEGPAAEWIVLSPGVHEIAVLTNEDEEGALARVHVRMPDGRVETRSSWVSPEDGTDSWRAFRIDLGAGTITAIDPVVANPPEENASGDNAEDEEEEEGEGKEARNSLRQDGIEFPYTINEIAAHAAGDSLPVPT